MWIFFDTATPKRGVQLSHDIESISCEDKAIKIYFKEDGPQTSLSIVAQPSRARRLPILVSFPSKEDANAAFVGMAEEMAKDSGNWFVSPAAEPKVARLYPKPKPSEREAVRNAEQFPTSPAHISEKAIADPYPFVDAVGKRFGFRWSPTAGCAEIVYEPELTVCGESPTHVFDETKWTPSMPKSIKYPFVGTSGKPFRIEQDGKGNVIFQYEDGIKTINQLDLFPKSTGE